MKRYDVDVAIIGAGTAGLTARRQVERRGASWVLIEGGPFGTTCARVGCMPSKLLIAAAEAAHGIQGAGRFGVEVDPGAWRVDGRAVMSRVRSERDRFAGFVVAASEKLPQEQVIRGMARFVGPTTLRVGEEAEVQARAVIIAAGSSPWIPPQLEAIREQVMVNDDLFELEDLPGSAAVVGTGIIGLELGQALHRLGVRVTLLNPFDELGPFTDPRLMEKAREAFGDELDLRLQSEIVEAAALPGGGAKLRWKDADGSPGEASFDIVLAAAGRRPNLTGLDLDRTGLPLDGRGFPPWDSLTTQCGEAPIFIAGDANHHLPLLHEAADEGRAAGANAVRWPEVQAPARRTPLAVAFTEPQIAIVGTPHADLDEDVAIGEVSYDDQGRARVMGINRGLVRIYAARDSEVIVGAEMLGPRVEHTAHLLAWVIQQGLTVQQTLAMPFYHPVIEEGIRTGLQDLARRLEG